MLTDTGDGGDPPFGGTGRGADLGGRPATGADPGPGKLLHLITFLTLT